MRGRQASVLLLLLLLAGCADRETQLPATIKILDDLPRVENSTKAPCWQQRQIAAQNSYVDTIRDKQARIYKAPCDVDGKQVAAKV
jgi:hypothetical protein